MCNSKGLRGFVLEIALFFVFLRLFYLCFARETVQTLARETVTTVATVTTVTTVMTPLCTTLYTVCIRSGGKGNGAERESVCVLTPFSSFAFFSVIPLL